MTDQYTSRVPLLIDAMVAQFEPLFAAADVSVSDGYDPSNDHRDKLMVGVDDPESVRPAPSGESQWDYANATGHNLNEDGSITLAAQSWNGQGDAKLARDAVYAIHNAVCAHVRASRSLGVPGVLWLRPSSSSQLQQAHSDEGAIALLVFRITFKARI